MIYMFPKLIKVLLMMFHNNVRERGNSPLYSQKNIKNSCLIQPFKYTKFAVPVDYTKVAKHKEMGCIFDCIIWFNSFMQINLFLYEDY